MELNDAIADSLIRAVNSVPKDWPGVVIVQVGIEDEIRQIAMTAPHNSKAFLLFLLATPQFRERLFTSTLPDELRILIDDLLERRSQIRNRKEELVASGDFDQAAKCRDMQQALADEIANRLGGISSVITIENVMIAIGRIGWSASE